MSADKATYLDAPTPSRKKALSVGQADDKKLIIQMPKTMWEQLRRLAFDLNISMAELCREGIGFVLEKNKKTVVIPRSAVCDEESPL